MKTLSKLLSELTLDEIQSRYAELLPFRDAASMLAKEKLIAEAFRRAQLAQRKLNQKEAMEKKS